MKITIEWMEVKNEDSYNFPMEFETYKDFNSFIVESCGLESRLGCNKVKFHILNEDMEYSGRLDYGGSLNGLYLLEKWVFDFIKWNLEQNEITKDEYKESLIKLKLDGKEWLSSYTLNERPEYIPPRERDSCVICKTSEWQDEMIETKDSRGYKSSYTCKTCAFELKELNNLDTNIIRRKVKKILNSYSKAFRVKKDYSYFGMKISTSNETFSQTEVETLKKYGLAWNYQDLEDLLKQSCITRDNAYVCYLRMLKVKG